MPAVAVITDDLSGGVALAAEFRTAGRTVMVVEGKTGAALPQADVLVVNTDSRNDSLSVSRKKNEAAVTALCASAPFWIVKKIDSLLRGHVGADIETLLAESGEKRCLVVPASPAGGRTTVDGHQWFEGRRIETQMKVMDRNADTLTDDVAKMIARETALQSRLIPLAVVREGKERIRTFIEACDAPLLIADSECQEDLNAVVAAAARAGIRVFAGTYGLGEALVCAETALKNAPPVLVVAGSTSLPTYRQVMHAARNAECDVITLAVQENDLLGTPGELAADCRNAVESAFRKGRNAILRTCYDPDDVAALWEKAKAHGWERRQLIDHVEACIVAAVKDVLPQAGGVVISGGATASAVFDAIDATRFFVEGPEILPGSPVLRIMDGPCRGLSCLTKPGSFGVDDDLLKMMRFLHCRSVGNGNGR